MTNNDYVVSIKRIKDYKGNILEKQNQYYEYLGIEQYTGIPFFCGLGACKTFRTIDDAKKYYEEISKYLDIEKNNRYDLSTLGVRQKIVKYKTQCRLEYLKG